MAQAPATGRHCSRCKNPILCGASYLVCSVSTCNRARTGLVFCSLDCWDAHVPVAGHRDAGQEARLVTVPNRSEAFRWLRETVQEGDAVILENDLPDLYERSAGLFWREGVRA